MAPFIDILALEEATLLMAAVVFAYVAVVGLFTMRRNDTAGLKAAFRGAAVPVAGLGLVATIFGVWGEMVWQYPAPYLTGYNILFNDIYLLFGLTLVIAGVSMALGLKLQYAGLFALVAGGVTMSYGYQGYILHYTKDPLETGLMYGAFGLAGVLALPATIVADHYLAYPETTAVPVTSAASVARRHSIQASTRAAQPIVPVGTDGTPDESVTVRSRFHLPLYVTLPVLAFVVVMILAGIAALWYLDATLPGHLASPP
jgi:uncharacterized membrane protein